MMRSWLVALLLAGCTVMPAPAPPAPGGDGGEVPIQGDVCEAAWKRAHDELHCVFRLPETGSWVDACKNARMNAISFGASCLARVPNCDAVPGCQ